MKEFISSCDALENLIPRWTDAAGRFLSIDSVRSYCGRDVFAFTFTDPDVPPEDKIPFYIAQPHSHEPGTMAGITDVINQLATGGDMFGRPASFDVTQAAKRLIVSLNPIGNPDGLSRAPVPFWDGSFCDNKAFWCFMRGEAPGSPGTPWKRVDEFDIRTERVPSPIGIVYEQVDEHTYAEPNRSRRSSYFRLFLMMRDKYHYRYWLNLHQTEFEGLDSNCVVFLPLEGLAEGKILEEDILWAEHIHDAWRNRGFRPKPHPHPLNYTGVQADYFRKNFKSFHDSTHVLTSEVKNNKPDASARFQLESSSVAVSSSIDYLLSL